MFLNEPHSTHRYYGELLNAYKNKFFLDTDAHEVYYASAYFNYFLEMKFRAGTLPKKYKKFKFHIMCAMRELFVGTQVNFGKARKQKKILIYYLKLLKIVREWNKAYQQQLCV